MKAQPIVYLSGAITSDPEYKLKFSTYSNILKSLKYGVVNPVEITKQCIGASEPELLLVCLKHLINCQYIFFINKSDIGKSDGVTTEYYFAKKAGIPILELNIQAIATRNIENKHSLLKAGIFEPLVFQELLQKFCEAEGLDYNSIVIKKARDQQSVICRYALIKTLLEFNLTAVLIGNLLNLDHSSVIYAKKQLKLKHYSLNCSENMKFAYNLMQKFKNNYLYDNFKVENA